MRATGFRMSGKDMKQRIGMALGKTGKKGKGKGKGKKSHGPQDQGKGQDHGKGEANYVNPSHTSQCSTQQAALPSSSNASGFFCDAFFYVLDISQDDRK